MWRTSVCRRVGSLVIAALLAVGQSRGDQPPACREGTCEPNCPVRPGQFGYYQTQWRRWPGSEPTTQRGRDAATPAPPARSLVPGSGEESPPQATPAAAVGPAVDRGLERLVTEADAARLRDVADQREFTGRLVTAMLTEDDPRSRCVVLGLAAGFDTPAAEAICLGALEDPDPRVRLTACQVCAERGGAETVERLAHRARQDADLGVRLRAVRTLGDIGDPAAVPHLVALLDDPDPAIQARAAAALERTTGRPFGTDVERWKAWAANPQAPAPRPSIGALFRGWF